MIGGGPDSFIGAIHRLAANLDGLIDLKCGAFSSNPQKSKITGKELAIADERIYETYAQMFKAEKELPEHERMDFVSIVTPNHLHFEPAKMALESGFHVVLDKPITFSLDEAKELDKIAQKTGKLFCLTHTYTGYPMVKQARKMVKDGALGKIRKIYVEYPQGWLYKAEDNSNKQAAWRTDPKKSGIAGCMGDIGTHAFNLAEYISDLKVEKLCADLNIVVEGRMLDDDGAVILKLENNCSGVLMASQITTGEENNLKIRVFGDKGGLEWQQADANTLKIMWPDQPAQIYRAGTGYLSDIAAHNCRTPAGHPEGYLEAFANHYRNFALCLSAQKNNLAVNELWKDYPGTKEGLRGMGFIETVVQSSASAEKWTNFIV